PGWAGLALFALLLVAGVLGPRDPFENPLPLALWTVVWILLPLATVFLGDLWRPVAPWRGPVRLTRRLLGRTAGIGLTRLGHLPAILGFLGFAWFEIVSLAPSDPLVLAKVAAAYWLAIFLLAVLEGEDWLDRGEMLTLYFATLARVAPLWRDRDGGRATLMLARPGAQIESLPPPSPTLFAFITLLIASVSF
ncbi:MAG: hypothetical protein KDJ78_20515, partial [Rhodobacteraceae bacterium]|nr:hypothetical protein [Paracoccaceae bacterium]